MTKRYYAGPFTEAQLGHLRAAARVSAERDALDELSGPEARAVEAMCDTVLETRQPVDVAAFLTRAEADALLAIVYFTEASTEDEPASRKRYFGAKALRAIAKLKG